MLVIEVERFKFQVGIGQFEDGSPFLRMAPSSTNFCSTGRRRGYKVDGSEGQYCAVLGMDSERGLL